MQYLRRLIGVGLIALVGCGPNGTDEEPAREGGHMLEQSQQQLEEAKKRAQEMAEVAAKRAEQFENVQQ